MVSGFCVSVKKQYDSRKKIDFSYHIFFISRYFSFRWSWVPNIWLLLYSGWGILLHLFLILLFIQSISLNKYFPPFALNSFLFWITNLVVAGGFGSYILAMDQKTYELIGTDYPGNRAVDVKNPSLGWMIGFMFVVSFLGLFSLVALRKVLIIPCLSVCYATTCSFWNGIERFAWLVSSCSAEVWSVLVVVRSW